MHDETPCPGGYCEMCPVALQIKCEQEMESPMTPQDYIDRIRRTIWEMHPRPGHPYGTWDWRQAAAIEQDLAGLEQLTSRPAAGGDDPGRDQWRHMRLSCPPDLPAGPKSE